MTVYIAIEHAGIDNGPSAIFGVFDSREKAQAAINDLPEHVRTNNEGIGGGFEIQRFEINKDRRAEWLLMCQPGSGVYR